ncbi:hypothetical protein NVP1244A_153 [Vibrio phage 1.244.A._10N.261.54.C3]|nr:hypothetical protein NVP1244A_153 [Vibrio phage 1.244.A._10N.261.54.C3]AUR98781.1 hypothetical protein NVP1255O_153 [Vibrio phage 1.255.O._10N.286.45.F1]
MSWRERLNEPRHFPNFTNKKNNMLLSVEDDLELLPELDDHDYPELIGEDQLGDYIN